MTLDDTLMVKLGENLVMTLPDPDVRNEYNVGEHRMVTVLDAGEAKWMCFDHGPHCWTTKALREYAECGWCELSLQADDGVCYRSEDGLHERSAERTP